MAKRSRKALIFAAAILLSLGALAPAAQAQNFFAPLFGGFDHRAPTVRMPFAGEDFRQNEPRSYDQGDSRSYAGRIDARSRYGSGQAYCVRTCDGRHFPVTGNDAQSRAETCKSFCPASETKLVYGGSIDEASTEDGKSYSALPNAFRYRTEIVAGCTCNGKDALGLASIGIDKDTTLRRGDIVAGANGLVVANTSDRRGASLQFSPASDRIKQRFQRPPVVAKGSD